jgi:hypothetical protein
MIVCNYLLLVWIAESNESQSHNDRDASEGSSTSIYPWLSLFLNRRHCVVAVNPHVNGTRTSSDVVCTTCMPADCDNDRTDISDSSSEEWTFAGTLKFQAFLQIGIATSNAAIVAIKIAESGHQALVVIFCIPISKTGHNHVPRFQQRKHSECLLSRPTSDLTLVSSQYLSQISTSVPNWSSISTGEIMNRSECRITSGYALWK